MRRVPVPVWFAGIPAAVVVLAGMILSYNALAVLALSAGIDPVLSWASDAALKVVREVEPVVVTDMHVVAAHEEAPNGRQVLRKSGTAGSANRRRVARLVKARPGVSASEAARRLGVSRSTASRLLSDVRKSRAVVEQEPITN